MVKHFYICFNGENLQKSFQETTEPKKVQIYLYGDLRQNQVVKVMIPERLGPQYRKVIVHVFIWEILINMTQVRDAALGSLVFICAFRYSFDIFNTLLYHTKLQIKFKFGFDLQIFHEVMALEP
jgi:hypothetical protein